MAKRTCPQCLVDFEVTGKGSGRKSYCSPKCWKASRPLCVGPECVKQAHVVDLCSAHYRQKRAGRELTVLRVLTPSVPIQCANPDCGRTFLGYTVGHRAKYCSKLCLQTVAYRARAERAAAFCDHPDGCSNPAWRRGLCSLHCGRFYRTGELGPVAPKHQDHGGDWHPDANGYIIRHKQGTKRGTELQHRVVMEEKLGRPLVPGESVHHVNGVRDDNRPENLELWSESQPSGQRVVDKIAWAVELLKLYQPDLLA